MNSMLYITFNILFILIGIVSVFPSMMSVMLFDAPGSKTWKNIILFLTIFSFPMVCFLSVVCSLICFEFFHIEKAQYFVLMPFMNIVVGFFAFFL